MATLPINVRDKNDTLAAMFPEFEATKSFQISLSKSMYLVNYGLAPYFKSVFKTNLHNADFLVYTFDEILNDVTQTTEMDLHVSYWKLVIMIPLSLDMEHIWTC